MNKINSQTGGSVADLFKDLVVPSWLVSQDNKLNGGSKHYDKDSDSDDEDEEVISDELHDKLIGLVTVNESEIKNNKKHTRRHKNKVTKNKGTKRK